MPDPNCIRPGSDPIIRSGSNGRTDGRTYEEMGSAGEQLTDRSARETCRNGDVPDDHWADPHSARVHPAVGRTGPGGRFEVLRTGDRDEIPAFLRIAVYDRDGNACKLCGIWLGESTKNLDHIVPWSAGGPDISTNLRTTCECCNRIRSNRPAAQDSRTLLPVTWWCMSCWSPENVRHLRREGALGSLGWRCLKPLVDPEANLVLAYCAFCGFTSYTDGTL